MFFLERRILFDYDKYGDSPACLGKDEDLAGKIALTQGFGKTELESDSPGKLLETNVTIISNEECYKNLNHIIKTNIHGYNSRMQIKDHVYDGITDQLLCTEGLIVERVLGSRTRKIITVSYFLI